MGKDNVPFHSVVFPACQLGTEEHWTMVNRLMATEYLNYEETKFSKSRGIGVFGHHAKETEISSDIWRFYLIYTRPENQDSSFKWDDILLKTNSELLGNLGNFVNRSLKFCKDNFSGEVQEICLNRDDQQFVALVSRHLSRYIDMMEDCRQRDAISEMLSISRLGNQLMQSNKPWKSVKSENKAEKKRAGSVVSLCVNSAVLLSLLMEPILPEMAKMLWKQLNLCRKQLPVLSKKFTCILKPGHVIGNPAPLVREIKPEEIKVLKDRFGGSTDIKTKIPQDEGQAGPLRAKVLEEQIKQQGDLVRQLKESKGDKDAIKTEVEKLIELKKHLAEVKGVPADATSKASKGGKKKGAKKQ